MRPEDACALDSHGFLRPVNVTEQDVSKFDGFKQALMCGEPTGKEEEEEVKEHAMVIVHKIASAPSLDDALNDLAPVLTNVSVYISAGVVTPLSFYDNWLCAS